MRRRIASVLVVVSALSACSRSVANPATTVTSTTSTTVPTTTTIETIPPPPTESIPPITTPASPPVAQQAGGPCTDPKDTQYCVWGTPPIDLTVNNSRYASFMTSTRQSFTAVSEGATTFTTQIGVEGAGQFSLAPSDLPLESTCVGIVLRTKTGLPVARVNLVAQSMQTSLEQVTVPLVSGLVPGARYVLELKSMPQCVGRTFTMMVAMNSAWKYPRDSGKLTIDGRESVGSLWARLG